MSNGMCPCFADVVQEELLEQLCPDELKEFREALAEVNISEHEFQQIWQSGESGPPEQENQAEAERVKKAAYGALEILIEAFDNKTGLELDIGYHDLANGDRYDEVSGLFFTVSGVYQYTDAGEKFKQFIERKNWVEFG